MTDELVRIAVQIWIDASEMEDTELLALLQELAGDAEMAAQLYEFLPLAFGRHFLAGIGVTLDSEFVRIDRRGRERHRGRLDDVPAYRTAARLAPEFAARSAERADGSFMAVAAGSAEVSAVSQLIACGSKAKDLVCVPPVLHWREPAREPSGRPWWRLWN